LFQKRIYSIFLGTLVGKRKQTIFKKRWFDITNWKSSCFPFYVQYKIVAIPQQVISAASKFKQSSVCWIKCAAYLVAEKMIICRIIQL
jgi:hypothetical protein